ncbi:alkaline phosphatase family protein [Paraglaciecola algarum]
MTKQAYHFSLKLFDEHNHTTWFDGELESEHVSQIQVGNHAFINLIDIHLKESIACGSRVSYDLSVIDEQGNKLAISQVCEDLLYPEQSFPSFVMSRKISRVLHGSCRKPHHNSTDGLVIVDKQINQALKGETQAPNLLIMSGDQVYADDVAGPMLVAIEQTIQQLGLFHEDINGAEITNSSELFQHPHGYYKRPELLPDTEDTENTYTQFFGGKKKPIFTSVNANNHLISFAEVIAMYILVWSPEMWSKVNISDQSIPDEFKDLFKREQTAIEQFAQGLTKVRRALAHIPVYMIFDDHDVTDDWNLTRGWEEAVYQDQFAKRIIGNALLGYWLCQGWGNTPAKLKPLFDNCIQHFTAECIIEHDQLVDKILDWEHWGFHLDTHPKVVVLDTRTQRWRSESSLTKPSGLMDWEALCELQQELIGQKSVIMVSAAPVFGVKLIETIQRIFTFFGKALTVDAENWMAHKGTASVMLNIFRNRKTPPNFVILSGDVHYSFVYDITLRFRQHSPQITQITSSGIKNEFPDALLRWFDRLNRILYSKVSPLNWFTKRRNMRVQHRRPQGQKVRTLLNSPGIGLLEIDENCDSVQATQLCVSGEHIRFKKHQD